MTPKPQPRRRSHKPSKTKTPKGVASSRLVRLRSLTAIIREEMGFMNGRKVSEDAEIHAAETAAKRILKRVSGWQKPETKIIYVYPRYQV